MEKRVRICLVGVSHFARDHYNSIRQMEREKLAELSCVVVRHPERYPEDVQKYRGEGVKVYYSYEDMLKSEQGRVDLVCLPTAIPDHSHQTIQALEAGYDVLVEKPPAPTIQELDAMIEAEESNPGFCAVGFQNQSKNTVRELKRQICLGRLGRIRSVRVRAAWIRTDSYYSRNEWAGQFEIDGRYVLDGPTGNALAHYLFNALYWCEATWGKAAMPAEVTAEIYKAHPIQGEDTAGLRVITEGGAEIYYLVTLAAEQECDPITYIEGDRGAAEWKMGANAVIWQDESGRGEVIPNDGRSEHDEVFRNTVKYLRGQAEELNCPLRMTRPYVLALNGAYESSGGSKPVPIRYVRRYEEGGETHTELKGINSAINECFRRHALYSEIGLEWARPTQPFRLRDYHEFSLQL